MFRRRFRYRRPILIRRPLARRWFWRPFWRPLGCGMGLMVPFCFFAMLLLAFVARHF